MFLLMLLNLQQIFIVQGQFQSSDGRLVRINCNGTWININALPLFASLDTLKLNYSKSVKCLP